MPHQSGDSLLPNQPPQKLRQFAGLYLKSGSIRRLTFEALSIEEAKEVAAGWGIGVEQEIGEGMTADPPPADSPETPEALTCTVWETVALLKLSRSTVYRLIAREVLRPLPGIRHKLIPRDQVARYAAGQPWQGRN